MRRREPGGDHLVQVRIGLRVDEFATVAWRGVRGVDRRKEANEQSAARRDRTGARRRCHRAPAAWQSRRSCRQTRTAAMISAARRGRPAVLTEMITTSSRTHHRCSPTTRRIFATAMCTDPARVGIERADLLRHAGRSWLCPSETGHLTEFLVFGFTISQRIDDVVAIASGIAAECGIDDDLQSVQGLAFARSSTSAPSPVRFHRGCCPVSLPWSPREVEPHGAGVTCRMKSMTWVSNLRSWNLRPFAPRCRRPRAIGRRRADHPIRQVLLADGQQIAREPVHHQPAGAHEERRP